MLVNTLIRYTKLEQTTGEDITWWDATTQVSSKSVHW